MKLRALVLVVSVAALGACDYGMDRNEQDGAVPPGAVPAAPDMRPGDQAGTDTGVSAGADTSAQAAPTDGTDTTTGATREVGIRPR